MNKSTDSLIRIVKAGASISVDSSKSTDSLIRIANALQQGATLTVTNADQKSTDSLIRIANANPGSVIFS